MKTIQAYIWANLPKLSLIFKVYYSEIFAMTKKNLTYQNKKY